MKSLAKTFDNAIPERAPNSGHRDSFYPQAKQKRCLHSHSMVWLPPGGYSIARLQRGFGHQRMALWPSTKLFKTQSSYLFMRSLSRNFLKTEPGTA